jgi:hypothetical protein
MTLGANQIAGICLGLAISAAAVWLHTRGVR